MPFDYCQCFRLNKDSINIWKVFNSGNYFFLLFFFPLATNMFLILNISWLCHGKQINVPEIIHFFLDNKISITLGRKINILHQECAYSQTRSPAHWNKLAYWCQYQLASGRNFCPPEPFMEMVCWLVEIFLTLIMSLCPCIWTLNQTPKQICFLCWLPQYCPIHLCYESYTDLIYCEKLCKFIQTSN